MRSLLRLSPAGHTVVRQAPRTPRTSAVSLGSSTRTDQNSDSPSNGSNGSNVDMSANPARLQAARATAEEPAVANPKAGDRSIMHALLGQHVFSGSPGPF